MNDKEITGTATKREREALGVLADIFYRKYIGLSPGAGSRWESGTLNLKRKHRTKIQKVVATMSAANQKYPDVPINWNDPRAIRKVFREIGRKDPPSRSRKFGAGISF